MTTTRTAPKVIAAAGWHAGMIAILAGVPLAACAAIPALAATAAIVAARHGTQVAALIRGLVTGLIRARKAAVRGQS